MADDVVLHAAEILEPLLAGGAGAVAGAAAGQAGADLYRHGMQLLQKLRLSRRGEMGDGGQRDMVIRALQQGIATDAIAVDDLVKLLELHAAVSPGAVTNVISGEVDNAVQGNTIVLEEGDFNMGGGASSAR